MSAVPAPEPRSRPAGSTTREQLDELDALLQRMLDLPVDPSGDGRQGPQDPPRAAAAVAELPPEVPVPAEAAPPEPARELSPGTPALPFPRAAPAPGGPETPVSRPTGDLAPLWFRLLVWLNQAFDRGAGRLGAPGHWLRRPRGRAALGWTGLAFLALAAVVVLLGWIGWPW